MFFTRFEFNPARRGAKHLLASPHRLHAAVLAAFPHSASTTSDDGRVLWRLDQPAHRALLYLVSPARPDLTHMVEEAGWPSTRTCDTRDYATLLDRLAARDTYAFRLTANPTFSRAQSEGRGKRLGHVTVNQQLGWLLDRIERYGFTIPVIEAHGDKEPDVTVLTRATHKFARGGRTITLATATYGGTLQVSNPDALRAALTRGIGPAKGYGCGLLTLAPAK